MSSVIREGWNKPARKPWPGGMHSLTLCSGPSLSQASTLKAAVGAGLRAARSTLTPARVAGVRAPSESSLARQGEQEAKSAHSCGLGWLIGHTLEQGSTLTVAGSGPSTPTFPSTPYRGVMVRDCPHSWRAGLPNRTAWR
jgi:hypothetical protein